MTNTLKPYMFEPCKDCGHDNRSGNHVAPWTCLRILKHRVKKLEEQLAAADETATRLNQAWREERARWAALDPARGLAMHGMTGPDDE